MPPSGERKADSRGGFQWPTTSGETAHAVTRRPTESAVELLRHQVWKLAEADSGSPPERESDQLAADEVQRLNQAIGQIRESTYETREKLLRVEAECKQLEEQLSVLGSAQGRREQDVDRLLAGLDDAATLTSPFNSRHSSPTRIRDVAERTPDPEQERLRRELRLKEAATRLLVARCRGAEAELSPTDPLAVAAKAAEAAIRTRQSKSPLMLAAPATAAALRSQLTRARLRHQEEVAKLNAEIEALRSSNQSIPSCAVEVRLDSEPTCAEEQSPQHDVSSPLQT